ncbi:MAG: ATP-binding protein [Calditrichaeota bacterium]|nr:ATP-binding protein [Calditrichota bacterium]
MKNLLIEQLWNSIKAPFPRYTPREIYGRISFPGKISTIIGIRRAGKTYFLYQLQQELNQTRGIERERLPYLNLEDERLAGITAADLADMIETYYRRYPQFRRDKEVIWFFDEIQYVPNWERFLRRLLDTEKVQIFVTGSSATLLSKEIATALRGRAWPVSIFPFSFREFLKHHHIAMPDNPGTLSSSERSFLEHALEKYLSIGGFPEAQDIDTESRYKLLSDYVDVAIFRDVVERHEVRNVTSLRWVVRHLLGNPAGLFSVEKFHRALKSQGLPVSKDTLHDFIHYLEDCFLIRVTWKESASERERMVNPRKIYPVDPGLIPVFDRSGKANLGHALETAVRIELERRQMDVTYIRLKNGYEVDFLTRRFGKPKQLIQVCAELNEESVKREIRGLEEAGKLFPDVERVLIVLIRANTLEIPTNINVVPAIEWFLEVPETND